VPEDYYQQYQGKPGVSEDTAKFFGMVENIDTNFGALLGKLKEWGIEDNTLVIFFTGDNGGTAGTSIFNGGLYGHKGSPYQGGTRATAFFRWPGGKILAGVECDALSAHLDIFPTLAELTGAKLSDEVKQQVEGRSLLPLLKNPRAEWPDRILVHHVGRWAKGNAADSKYRNCAIQSARFTLVNNKELYDLKADPGEKTNVMAEHPEVVANLRAAYDKWWSNVQPVLVNENVVGPKMNPMKELYWKQFGGGPDARLLDRMNPNKNAVDESEDQPVEKNKRKEKAQL
jgi:arylsulfatase